MDRADVFAQLNQRQRDAVEAVAGPVCILAGAGSGKTTTITRRIANQVLTRTFEPAAILAVTFTDKAAGEMRGRLAALGVEGVRARTFHSAALQQLRYFAHEPPPQIMPSKVVALRQIANTLPRPYRFRPAADLATEIEWAKNRRVPAHLYLDSLNSHEPPIPEDLMATVYKRYERGKSERHLIDFEDLLERTIQMFDADEAAVEEFGARYGAFTVDEYQDVNLLQETLLRRWVGERDQLCVVGDDYQSIYGFTGATPRHLLEMPSRFVGTKIVRLEENYRSTPQVLEIANRLVPRLGGAEKVLRAVRGDGPECMLRTFSTPAAETAFLVDRIRALHEQGVPYEEMAILYRLNFRSEDYEEALAAESIPYQVRDGAFLTRQTARQMITSLRRKSSAAVAEQVGRLAARAGYLESLPDGLGEQEITRQNDLGRFIRLAEEFDDGTRTCADFVSDIEGRFGTEGGRGVNLLTYHRAKGLEFEAVLLPQLQDGELPFRRSRSEEAVAEERRLFYVGITRAKSTLAITWVNDGRRKASAFVGELREGQAPASKTIPQRAGGASIDPDLGALQEKANRASTGPALGALKEWRKQRSKVDSVPAFIVFHDATLEEIAEQQPATLKDLAAIPGIGPTKLERYGREVLTVLHASAGAEQKG